MTMLRNRLKGARFAPFSFVVGLLTIVPSQIGYQDIAALLARQPGVAERWQQHMFASTRRSMQIASFDLPRPVGTYVPDTAWVRLASLDGNADITGSINRNPLGQILKPLRAADFPVVVRATKSDRLPLPQIEGAVTPEPVQTPEDPSTSNRSVSGSKTSEIPTEPTSKPPLDAELEAALQAPRLPQYDGALNSEAPITPPNELPDAAASANASDAAAEGFLFQTSRVLFGNGASAPLGEQLERWQPGEEPIIVLPGADPDMKKLASLPVDPAEIVPSGESIAGKGEVTGKQQRPRTPAERLGLDEKSRAKAEKCLTEVIYFEARGEAVRGQMAVAQVVINRAFSGYYPSTVCGVVYQNKHRHLACQFTFACDNVRDVVTEPDMWERAQKIAKATLDGQLWLPEVGKSTHYHAYWVRPSWVNEMKKMYKTGVHTFYRPRAWGDGADAPSWGTVAQTASISAELSRDKP